MSSESVVKIERLQKCYQIYEKPHHRLLQMLMRGKRQYYREFWALKNVSMEVRKGETVGIVGRNGCGKSTLLQVICGILNPTGGLVQTSGRIAALLELGSGFNPEFTGRENVYMNASVLGLNHEEIDSRFKEIADFADIGEFIDRPVKTYSSGMSVRLAFAVAINVDPEILVIDEALAVGDELFQRKCYARIEEIKAKGATILFVSHSSGAVVSLCDRAYLLDSGEKIASGQPKYIVGQYQRLLYAPQEKRIEIREDILARCSEENNIVKEQRCDGRHKPIHAAGKKENIDESEIFDPHLIPVDTITYESKGAIIDDARIETVDGRRVNNLERGRSYVYRYKVSFKADARNVRFGMLIKTISGVWLGGAQSVPFTGSGIEVVSSNSCYDIAFTFNATLNPGIYFLNAGVQGQIGEEDGYLHRVEDIAAFRILPDAKRNSTAIVDFGCKPEVHLVAE